MRQPFTPEGVASVMANLYNLSDDALTNEVVSFRHDPKQWLKVSFEMNSHQEEYLQQLNPVAMDFFAQQGGFAMQHRLPINLAVAASGDEPDEEGEKDKQGKIVYTKSTVTAVANGKGEILPQGALEFRIRY